MHQLVVCFYRLLFINFVRILGSGSFFNLLADVKYYYFVFFFAAQVTPSPQTVFRTSSFSLVGVTHVNLPIIKSKRFSLDKVTAKVRTWVTYKEDKIGFNTRFLLLKGAMSQYFWCFLIKTWQMQFHVAFTLLLGNILLRIQEDLP